MQLDFPQVIPIQLCVIIQLSLIKSKSLFLQCSAARFLNALRNDPWLLTLAFSREELLFHHEEAAQTSIDRHSLFTLFCCFDPEHLFQSVSINYFIMKCHQFRWNFYLSSVHLNLVEWQEWRENLVETKVFYLLWWMP